MSVSAVESVTIFLRAMFPGDALRNVPSIDALADFEEKLPKFRNIEIITEILASSTVDSNNDINEILKNMKGQYGSSVISEFSSDCLEYYFGHRDVTKYLINKNSPLFPHETILEDIDYDIIEPVYLRGL